MDNTILFSYLDLPCGAQLKNRIVKAPMSETLASGTGTPTEAQVDLYQSWSKGGAGLIVVGEMQVDYRYPENPGNLVALESEKHLSFRELAKTASQFHTHLWLQLGHAGALSFPEISSPAGPTSFAHPDFTCRELTLSEIREIPEKFAGAAKVAQDVGFSGIEIHAAHGFLLSQFLSPLLNRRKDEYGGSEFARFRLLEEVLSEVRAIVGINFPIGLKINSTDKLVGGLEEEDALSYLQLLNSLDVDLIEVSGGTYLPGFVPNPHTKGKKRPYYSEFTKRAREITEVQIIITGGIRSQGEALSTLNNVHADAIGMARALVLEPDLPNLWMEGQNIEPRFPRFEKIRPGDITSWYTARIRKIAEGNKTDPIPSLEDAVQDCLNHNKIHQEKWMANTWDSRP